MGWRVASTRPRGYCCDVIGMAWPSLGARVPAAVGLLLDHGWHWTVQGGEVELCGTMARVREEGEERRGNMAGMVGSMHVLASITRVAVHG